MFVRVGAVAVVVLSCCGCGHVDSSGPAAGPTDAGDPTDGAPAATSPTECPLASAGELTLDGVQVPISKLVIDEGTTEPTAVVLELVSAAPDGSERDTFVMLRGLVKGQSTTLSPLSALEYREYPPGAGERSPSFSEVYREAALSGTVNVINVAANPGEVTCGTFDLSGRGTKSMQTKGTFRIKLLGPQPG